MKKFMIIAVAAMAMTACGSKTENTADRHDEATEHEHHHDMNCHHAHEIAIAGVAQATDSVDGHITIVKLLDGQQQTFDYSSANPDKVAAWQPGDTVTVFLHHHHGEEAHDSITAIKIGNHDCCPHGHGACPEGHEHECPDHEHGHEHHHAH